MATVCTLVPDVGAQRRNRLMDERFYSLQYCVEIGILWFEYRMVGVIWKCHWLALKDHIANEENQ